MRKTILKKDRGDINSDIGKQCLASIDKYVRLWEKNKFKYHHREELDAYNATWNGKWRDDGGRHCQFHVTHDSKVYTFDF